MHIYKQKKFLLVISVLILFLSTPPALFAGTVTLSWSPPTSNENGTRLSDLAGYKVYYGTTSGKYSRSIDVGNVTSYTVYNLADSATYFFAATAYDRSGNESEFSNEVVKMIGNPLTSVKRFTIGVNKTGAGKGVITSSPSGIYCGNDCTELYGTGSIVTLTASSEPGSSFHGWSGGNCTGNGKCILTVNGNANITAKFVGMERNAKITGMGKQYVFPVSAMVWGTSGVTIPIKAAAEVPGGGKGSGSTITLVSGDYIFKFPYSKISWRKNYVFIPFSAITQISP
ncbi:MAG: fibronectin type III domain-containing protein [Nitrospirota bacterium]